VPDATAPDARNFPSFDFLPQHFQVSKLLSLCVNLLQVAPVDASVVDQALSVLREFEHISVWGEWTERDFEQALEGYRDAENVEDSTTSDEEPLRRLYRSALHDYQDAHQPTESDVNMLEALLRTELDRHYQ
jgi:hypothetical protein